MKGFYLWTLSLLLIGAHRSYAQGCFSSTFEGACTSSGTCATWSDACSAGWTRSHGTPNYGAYTVEIKGQLITKYFAYMWSTGGNSGEGMFASHLFQNAHTYEVKLTVATTNALGKIRVLAAKNLVQGGTSACGSAPQDVPHVLIGEYYGATNGEIELSFTFTNNSGEDLDQLWIYPEGTGGGQYELFVKWVQACPSCDGVVTHYQGVVPTGISKGGTINAGSSAGPGSGVVTVNPTATTNFYAVHEINLLPDFEANVTSGTFNAEVFQCYLLPAGRMETWGKMPLIAPSNDLAVVTPFAINDKLNVYPSVTTGLINISGDPKLLENAEVKVLDLSGRVVMTIPGRTSAGMKTLNLGSLNNGVYLIQVKQKENSIIKKIIIQK